MISILPEATERDSEAPDRSGAGTSVQGDEWTWGAAANELALPEGASCEDSISARQQMPERERERIGWGRRYSPEIVDRAARQEFSQVCQSVLTELNDLEAADYYVNGVVTSEGAGVVAQVGSHLETMFDSPFGEGESLKSVVVAIQSQVNNVDWTRDIVEFLRKAMSFLCVRYVVNDQTVDRIYDMMKEQNLDPFRGSVSDRGIKTRYRLIEVDDR